MNEPVITSRDNPLARRARAIRDGKAEGRIFIEGLRLAEEAARSSLAIDSVLCTEKFAQDERGGMLLAQLKAKQEEEQQQQQRITFVSEKVFASVSDTKSPQGIVILAAQPNTGREVLEQRMDGTPLLVIMHKLNNPANAGAILRSAEAAGATGAIATAGTTDLFSPKALRGAMGSSLRLPLWIGGSFAEVLDWCRLRRIATVGSEPRAAAQVYTEIDWTRASALVVGSEPRGLKETETEALDESVSIPMRAPVESLNVAVATAILLYEAARQREVEPRCHGAEALQP